MRSQVSGECEVELKYLGLLGGLRRACPNEASSLPFYRPREGPGYTREKDKKKKEKNQEEWSLGAASSFSAGGSC
jgi:hypothetical protein